MNTKAVMTITDEQIAEIEGEALEAVQINWPTSISGARILALISRLREAEAKLNTICVELPESLWAGDIGDSVIKLDDMIYALSSAGVAYK